MDPAFAVVSFVDSPTEKDFVLEVGIGLPTDAANSLSNFLLRNPLSAPVVDNMREYRQLKDETPDTDERWMANFYRSVGTFGVSWIAQVTR
jgi:hypothetical protein